MIKTKDKELREIVYRSCKEFDEKLEFLFKELCKINPELKKSDEDNPFTRLGEFFLILNVSPILILNIDMNML